jgi:glycosyltransferase involved in cell wall biosynthesis
MRIAFDASSMPARRAGAGRVMHELGHALAEYSGTHPLLFLDRFGAFADLADRPGVTVHHVPQYGRARRFAWEQTRLPVVVRRWRAGVLHGLHHSLPLVPASPAAVAMVHDVTFDVLPDRYPPPRRWYMRLITWLGVLRANRIIVPSSWVKSALVRRYRVPDDRVVVIPLAPPAGMTRVTDPQRLDEVRRRYALPRRFLLSVGTLEPGKNRETLARAVGGLQREGLELPLVVAGQQGWDRPGGGTSGRIQPGSRGSELRYLGYVPDADLAALYSLADVFLFPSWLEGFGLPPLEALACGTPVVSSNRPAMTEVLGDAALYADPRDPVAWADAIRLLHDDDAGMRARLTARGPERAARFSWRRAALETLDVYAAALQDARAGRASAVEGGRQAG